MTPATFMWFTNAVASVVAAFLLFWVLMGGVVMALVLRAQGRPGEAAACLLASVAAYALLRPLARVLRGLLDDPPCS